MFFTNLLHRRTRGACRSLHRSPRRRLLLARDRMGQKPLYYAKLPDGGLVFASEPKAILAHPEMGRALDQPDRLRLRGHLLFHLLLSHVALCPEHRGAA